ncbi:hypothetical protein DFJ74DRAFT_610653 [Hyaloraphidium curvatum]|nr:hypothetical protein DFJ74DRAFT_610653 [Hyaloraphidium curvatum]
MDSPESTAVPVPAEQWQTVRSHRRADSSASPEPDPQDEFPPLPAPAHLSRREEPPTGSHFAPYVSGTLRYAHGVLHLFRNTPPSLPDSMPVPTGPPGPEEHALALLAIPSYVSAGDLLALLPNPRGITHIRLIRDSQPSRYTCVLRFKSEGALEEFKKRAEGKRWTGGGNWNVVRLAGVMFVERKNADNVRLEPVEKLFRLDQGNGVELPTCPVCLDRLDPPTSGLLTTLCLHTFHPPCLAPVPRCPVCRHPTHPSDDPDPQQCDCGASRDLWICLICGHVGCGRYVNGCAQRHHESTSHRFALEIGEGRVWDYRGDGYVHRLVRDKDGSVVPIPSPSDPLLEYSLDRPPPDGGADRPSDLVAREKVDALGLEWAHSVAREMESQRRYFEGKLREAEERWEAGLLSVREDLETTKTDRNRLASELEETKKKLDGAERDRQGMRKVLEQSTVRLREAQTSLEEEKAMAANLREGLAKLKTEVAAKDTELGELRETVRDLMVALEVGKQVEERPELAGAGLEVGASPKRSRARKK